ncbi:unnamed protein product [Somion occarium]|uniref:Fungal-type protein kinase domain-containing protein n=1 Tax=Somion occarium TaxID=3059160 RepID=A0ABP1DYT1_9APHY
MSIPSDHTTHSDSPPPANPEPPPDDEGTPYKFTLQGWIQWCNKYIYYDDLREMLIEEMTGLFVGPMPPHNFIDALMRLKKKLKAAPKVDFSEVPFTGVEKDMYEPLCNAINDSLVCPGFKLVDVSSSVDKNGIRLRPDLVLVPTDAKDMMDYTIMEFFVEVKVAKPADPFYDINSKALKETIEKMKGDSAETRGQITSYAAALLSRQHRTFAFSITICGQYVRFFRWDRAGCIVSDTFNFLEDSHLLAEFFWCYAHMTREQRGFDPTVVPASAAQAKLLSDALSQYIKESRPRNVSYLQPKPDSTYPISKMQVPTTNGIRELIVGKPFQDSNSPCGRATRAYAAYDLVEKKVVFAKDYWRDEGKGLLSEAEFYDILKQSNVPFLPEVIAAGDLYVKPKQRNACQKTYTQKYSPSRANRPKWCQPCAELRTLVHCRVVQKLTFPLPSALSSKEAVQTIRDAIEALKVAYHHGKVFHRDISTGNIMIDESGRGILNDWDHAQKVGFKNITQTYQTGVWQFRSILLLRHPKKGHDIHDDLESSFWVLLYISLHYFEHNQGIILDFSFFDEYKKHVGLKKQEEDVRDNCYSMKSSSRKSFLTDGLADVQWKCAPLNKLIHGLRIFFEDYLFYHSRQDDDKHMASFKDIQEKTVQVDVILNLFDSALASNDWPENDALSDQYPPMTDKQTAQLLHDLESRAIASAARKKKKSTALAVGRRASVPSTALGCMRIRSCIPGIRSSKRLAQPKNGQQAPAPEAEPSQLPMSSHGTVKRRLNEDPAKLSSFRSKRAKIAK